MQLKSFQIANGSSAVTEPNFHRLKDNLTAYFQTYNNLNIKCTLQGLVLSSSFLISFTEFPQTYGDANNWFCLLNTFLYTAYLNIFMINTVIITEIPLIAVCQLQGRMYRPHLLGTFFFTLYLRELRQEQVNVQ